MSSEANLWATARRALAPYGKLQRLETPSTADGVPDVLYCLLKRTGLLELKYLDEWPRRPTTPVRLPRLTLEQVLWLEGWAGAGGAAHVLLQVERDYLLLDAAAARSLYDRRLDRADLRGVAAAHGALKFPTAAIVRALAPRALPELPY